MMSLSLILQNISQKSMEKPGGSLDLERLADVSLRLRVRSERRSFTTPPPGAPAQEGYEQVDFETLLTQSDIISVHAPLNEHTEGLINSKAFEKMRSSCIFLNLGRGPIVDEQALYNALVRNQIAAAGLDVLCEEPMSADNPLVQFKDSKRLLITPHIAWASVEARTHLMEIIHGQVKDFFA